MTLYDYYYTLLPTAQKKKDFIKMVKGLFGSVAKCKSGPDTVDTKKKLEMLYTAVQSGPAWMWEDV